MLAYSLTSVAKRHISPARRCSTKFVLVSIGRIGLLQSNCNRDAGKSSQRN